MRNLTKAIILLSAALALFSCGGEPAPMSDTTAADTTIAEPAAAETVIVADGVSGFTIIRAEDGAQTIVQSVVNFKKKLDACTGAAFDIATDFYNPRTQEAVFPDPEILVGETNRPETAEVLAALPENSYTITRVGSKLVIVGTDPNLTVLALQRFEETVLNNSARCGAGKLVFSDADAVTVTFDAPLTLADLIASGFQVTAESEQVMHCPAYSSEIRVAQGAASDGTYAYFVIRHTKDEGAVVYKHRLDDGTRVAQSEVIQVGHGNDATFDTKNNRLVIAHGQSQGKMLTMVDPETLKVIEVVNIPAGSGAISYSAASDRYAISQGGSTLHILDANFKLLSSYTRQKNSSYTAQGMGSDEQYVYFPMSGSKDNVIEVYSWDGDYVTTINVPDSFESESLFWVNDTYYIAYYKGASNAGAYLYRLNFRIIYA